MNGSSRCFFDLTVAGIPSSKEDATINTHKSNTKRKRYNTYATTSTTHYICIWTWVNQYGRLQAEGWLETQYWIMLAWSRSLDEHNRGSTNSVYRRNIEDSSLFHYHCGEFLVKILLLCGPIPPVVESTDVNIACLTPRIHWLYCLLFSCSYLRCTDDRGQWQFDWALELNTLISTKGFSNLPPHNPYTAISSWAPWWQSSETGVPLKV